MKPLENMGLRALGIAAGFVVVAWGLSLLVRVPAESTESRYVSRAFGFAIDVPAGYKALTEDNGVIIVPTPTRDNPSPVPVLQVRVRPIGNGAGVPDGSKVYTHGGKAYVVSLWRGTPWPLFDVVAASLTFTK